MSAPLCTPGEVAETLGVPEYTGVELTQVARLCVQVSGLIRAKRRQIDVWIAAGQVDPDIVSGVACQVVARVKTSVATGGVGIKTETHPEYSYTLTSAAAAGLALTLDELSLLTPAVGDLAAFTIRPGALPSHRHHHFPRPPSWCGP